ncbi:hypothetical protein AB0A73_06280 [Glycomyces sp. NPDC047369]
MSGRTKFYGIIALIMAPFMFYGGFTMTTSDEVDCGGQTMAEGDICTTYDDGSSTDRTMDEQRSDNKGTGVILFVVGAGMAAFGVFTVVQIARGRQAAPVMHQPHPGQYAPQPGYPQQPAPGQYPPPGAYPQQQYPQPGYPPQQPGQWQQQPPPGYPPQR